MAPCSRPARTLLLQRVLISNRKRKEMFQRVIVIIQVMKMKILKIVLLIYTLTLAAKGNLGITLGL